MKKLASNVYFFAGIVDKKKKKKKRVKVNITVVILTKRFLTVHNFISFLRAKFS
jgi:hypothetical protein